MLIPRQVRMTSAMAMERTTRCKMWVPLTQHPSSKSPIPRSQLYSIPTHIHTYAVQYGCGRHSFCEYCSGECRSTKLEKYLEHKYNVTNAYTLTSLISSTSSVFTAPFPHFGVFSSSPSLRSPVPSLTPLSTSDATHVGQVALCFADDFASYPRLYAFPQTHFQTGITFAVGSRV